MTLGTAIRLTVATAFVYGVVMKTSGSRARFGVRFAWVTLCCFASSCSNDAASSPSPSNTDVETSSSEAGSSSTGVVPTSTTTSTPPSPQVPTPTDTTNPTSGTTAEQTTEQDLPTQDSNEAVTSDTPSSTGTTDAANTGVPSSETGDGQSTLSPSETALSIEEFCAAKVGLQQPWCDYRDRCCTAEDVASRWTTLPGCQYMEEELADCVAGIESDVSEDGLTFDGHWAQACVDALAPFALQPPTDCKGVLRDWADETNHDAPLMWELEACQLMLTANVEDGELCNNVRACKPGLGCGPSSGIDDEFRCHARFGLNESCYSDNECQTGLVCRPLDYGRCQPLSPTFGDCDVADHCEDGNICHLDYCGPTLQLGDECPNATFCAASLACNFLDLTCASLLPAGAGPCDNDLDCEGRCDLTTETCVEICGGTR